MSQMGMPTTKNISRLHYITHDMHGFSHALLAEFACKGGAEWIQLRVKNKPFAEWMKNAEEVKKVCLNYNAKLIVNDNVQIAKEIHADGVHLGKEDMPCAEARKILGEQFIIGGTANTYEDVMKLLAEKADYIGLGPYRFTATKNKLSPVLGLEGIKNIIQHTFTQNHTGWYCPVIAIGGIKPEDISALLQAGVYGVAVSSYINSASDKMQAIKKLTAETQKPLMK